MVTIVLPPSVAVNHTSKCPTCEQIGITCNSLVEACGTDTNGLMHGCSTIELMSQTSESVNYNYNSMYQHSFQNCAIRFLYRAKALVGHLPSH